MPVITVSGLPVPGIWRDSEQPLRQLLEERIPSAVAGIVELGLTTDQVTVFAPPDLLPRRSRPELIVWIEGLTAKPERTLEVQQRLSDAVAESLRCFCAAHWTKCKLVEVFVRPFDPTITAMTSLALPSDAHSCGHSGQSTLLNGQRT